MKAQVHAIEPDVGVLIDAAEAKLDVLLFCPDA
jgi:hypothetical protein